MAIAGVVVLLPVQHPRQRTLRIDDALVIRAVPTGESFFAPLYERGCFTRALPPLERSDQLTDGHERALSLYFPGPALLVYLAGLMCFVSGLIAAPSAGRHDTARKCHDLHLVQPVFLPALPVPFQ